MIIEKREIPKYKSKYGNRFNEITEQDLVKIANGKVLCLNDGEYSTFIYLEDENVKLEHDPVAILRKILMGE